jgi:hypothetical protein
MPGNQFAAVAAKPTADDVDPFAKLAGMALDRTVRETVRLDCLAALARDYPLSSGEKPTRENLRKVLERFDNEAKG